MIAIKKINWDEVPLKFLFSKRAGGSWGTDPDLEDKGVICLRAADFITHELRHSIHDLTRRKYENHEIASKQLRKGDLILEKSGGGEKQPVGRVISFELDEVALCSNFLELLRPRQAFLYSRFGTYLFYSLWSTRAVLKYIKQTTGIQNLDAEEYLSQIVEIPPLSQQRQIADYLDRATQKIDALIAAKKRLLELLAEKRRALITQAVTRGLGKDVIMRKPEFDLLERVSKHGKAPLISAHSIRINPWQPAHSSGWRFVQIKVGYDITLGKMLHNEATSPEDLEVPYLKNQHVQWDQVVLQDLPTMWASPWEVKMLNVHTGDLLVCEGGDVGRAGIVAGIPPENCIIQNALHLVRAKHGNSTHFLRYLLQHAASHGWFEVLCNRATIAHFTAEKFNQMWIWLPSAQQQQHIVEYLDHEIQKIDALISTTNIAMALLQERRTSLISAAVTGQLPIPD